MEYANLREVYAMVEKKHVKFPGRLVFVGFGSVGQGTLPLLLRRLLRDFSEAAPLFSLPSSSSSSSDPSEWTPSS